MNLINEYKFSLIGLLFLLFLTFLVSLLFKAPSYSGDNIYKVSFDNAAGVKTGTLVEYLGVPVGKVKEVNLDKNYNPVVELYIDKSIKIPDDSSLTVKENDFLSNKIIQLNLGINDTIMANNETILESNVGLSTLDIVDLVIAYVKDLMDNK